MIRTGAACAVWLILSACASAPSSSPVANTPQGPTPAPWAAKIRHIVVIVQENRSFDNLFQGFPGADTAPSGQMSTGRTVTLAPVPFEDPSDVGHSHINFEREYANGKLFFDLGAPGGLAPTFPYAYVPQAETKPLWAIARQYVLADRTFQSNNGPSFPAHLYLIAGQSKLADENPSVGAPATPSAWGCDDPPGTTVPLLGTSVQDRPGPFPCFDFPTVGDALDVHGRTWRYYAPSVAATSTSPGGVWSAYDAIAHIRRGPDWTANVVSPETRILADASRPLPDVTYVVPAYENSDHAGSESASGPNWVASVVNAVGTSTNWNSTAIFIIWDDWGGWFDHVAPPQIDSMGLGFRVPLLVVSPYAKAGYVSHVQHESVSILRFIEETFGLSTFGNVDARADDIADAFNFNGAPRAFIPITVARSHQRLRTHTEGHAPDDE